MEYIAEIDDETALFINKYQKTELVRRGARELEWITGYPWVLQAPFSDISSSRYFFSAVAQVFYYLKIKVLDSTGAIVAFIILRFRDQHLTMPYAYFDPSNITAVFRVICHHIIALNAISFETCNEHLISELNKANFPVVVKRTRDRHSYISKSLANADVASLDLQDGDGDKAFT